MINAVLGIKGHMAQSFTPEGKRVAVTVVKTGQNVITQVKTVGKDGYQALQLGFGTRKIKNISKPVLGHIKKASTSAGTGIRYLKEVRITTGEQVKKDDKITPQEIFKPGDFVRVTAVSKGKGFAGVVKRWRFAGGPKTHGQSDRERAPGAIGQGTTPGRVYKGKKMPGRMGTKKTTVKNLVVLAVNKEGSQLKLSGPVPGARGSLLLIRKVSV